MYGMASEEGNWGRFNNPNHRHAGFHQTAQLYAA